MGVVGERLGSLIEYDTAKLVHIRSKWVGLLHLTFQLCLAFYAFGYVIVIDKGYQEFGPIESVVTTKLKGVIDTRHNGSDIYQRIWDVPDYVVPPQENGAFFIMTNVIITPNQSQSECPESPRISSCGQSSPKANSTCIAGQTTPNGNGVMTGRCVPYGKLFTCEVYGWCPVEESTLPSGYSTALLKGSRNFTVLIKNNIEFPTFQTLTRNVEEGIDLKSCVYDPELSPNCPIFRLDDIVRRAGEDFDKLAVLGGAIAIVINWNCNLDFDVSYCKPSYSFRSLDPKSANYPGWNFRYAHYFSDQVRTLYKAYGIRFVVVVQGRAGKFSIVPLLLNVGSAVGLLSLSNFICDYIVINCLKKRNVVIEV